MREQSSLCSNGPKEAGMEGVIGEGKEETVCMYVAQVAVFGSAIRTSGLYNTTLQAHSYTHTVNIIYNGTMIGNFPLVRYAYIPS